MSGPWRRFKQSQKAEDDEEEEEEEHWEDSIALVMAEVLLSLA